MFTKILLLALMGGAHAALSVDVPKLTLTCATMKCATGACEDTLTGPKCVKMGSCPVLKPGTIGTCVEMCSGDTACDGDKKCCSNGCGHVCTDPVKDAVTIKPPVTTCAMMKCSAGHMCVDLPTGRKCVPNIRPGRCPLVLCAVQVNRTAIKCESSCDTDSDCKDSTHKCCNQCGCNQCVKPLTLSVGCAAVLCMRGQKCIETPTGGKCVNDTVQFDNHCPLSICSLIGRLTPVTCKDDACNDDDDCDDDEKCCKGCDGCGFCHKPPKVPSCDDIDCMPGHVCELKKVVCVRAPCHPVPTCVLHKCLQPKQPGLCKAIFPSWYFDSNSRKCMPFNYGGCGGNENRFSTKKDCKKACRRELKCPKDDDDDDKDCEKKNECSRREGRNLPVCPQGQSCCRTPCGRKCKVPVLD